MYAKLIKNKLQYAPKNYKTNDVLILNFNKNIELMKKYGFKEVIDIKPEYDSSTHYLSIDGYSEDETTITINYKINEIFVDTTPTFEERLTTLEQQFKDIDQLQLLKQE